MLTEIITAIITSGLIIGLLELVRDWKNNRKMGNTHAAKEDYNAQKEGLDLVSEFYNKVKQITDDSQVEIKADLKEIKTDLRNITTYLNGDYAAWLKGNKVSDSIPPEETSC